MLNYVHRQFSAGPVADLVKDPSLSIFYVLLGDAQSFGYVACHLNFFRGENIATGSVDGHRRNDSDYIDDNQFRNGSMQSGSR
jgi:hypothetical protein